MKIRGKLLLPTLLTFFLGFLGFVAFMSLDQSSRKKAELSAYADKLTVLAATANSAYIWNFDTIGLNESLSAFRMLREIVSIEVFDAQGGSIAKLEAEEIKGKTILREADVIHEGTMIGKVKLAFTDAFVAADIRN